MHIPHDHPPVVSTPHFNHPVLVGRHRTWEILCREGAPLTWLPRMADVAMTHFPNATCVAEICAAPEFSAKCNAHPYPYAGTTITSDLALSALTDSKRALFSRYIRAQFRDLAGYYSFRDEQQRLDAMELLEDVYYTSIGKFRVGTQTESSGIETWGWEAYLALRLVRSVSDKLRMRGRFSPEASDDAVFRNAPDDNADPDRLFGMSAVRYSVARVLAALLTNPEEQSIYRGLVYGSLSYKQLAAQHGCSISTIAHRVTGPLINSLREILGEEHPGRDGKTSFRLLRDPLAHSIPEEIFDRLIAVRPARLANFLPDLQAGI